jgi:two-component sensor histidine kinase
MKPWRISSAALTKRKEMEEKIENQLKEKEPILKEAHHRIKNNLSVIPSLLELQASVREDSVSHGALLNAAEAKDDLVPPTV